jgi:TetR/AcrR family transcriptional regulator, regulator of autoinduction and epiphytic fitness
MGEVNRDTRRYVSPLRRDAAARTRQAVLDAARELFAAQGYTATTIEQIAGRAGVSKPTVFAAVGSKQAILKQLRDIALAGDDEPVPVAQRPWYREALAEPDPRRALRLYARNATAIHRRAADVHEVLRAAAASDQDLHGLWRASEDERRGGAAIVVDALLGQSPLKAGLDRAAAIDIVWVLTASDIFWRLVRTRRWSHAQYENWLGDTLCAQLLPPARGHSRS